MSANGSMPAEPRPLRGRRVVTTRERIGELDRRLARLGADVVHVPLIGVAEPDDGGAALAAALERLDTFDWVVVTSPNGAGRVGPALGQADVKVATVGTRTAAVIARSSGRDADLVPDEQTALALAAAMPPASGERLLLAQADRADPAHAAAFAERGYDVTAVVAYRTMLRMPTVAERRAALAADALALASGSAARAWRQAVGSDTPPAVVAIGPSTEAVAVRAGIKVTHCAADHSIDGLVAEVVRALGPTP